LTLESFGISNIGPPKILWENSHIFIETFGKLPPFISYHKVATTSISEASKEIISGEVKVYTADGRYVGKSVPNRIGQQKEESYSRVIHPYNIQV
jgi:hypothetical protein